jgi:6-pyruvoyltetrahydropterin/6-carboxytetrahydropterin synthase
MKQKLSGQTIMVAKTRLTKRVMISAMHELRSPKLSEEQNRKIFGKCCNQHGHDYWLEVTVEGTIDGDSGLVCDRDFFEDKLEECFVAPFDKTDLNHFFPNTTGENLALEFYKKLKKDLTPLQVIGVRLQETPKNFFTCGTEGFLASPF